MVTSSNITIVVDFDGVTAELPKLRRNDEEELLNSSHVPGSYDTLPEFFQNIPSEFDPQKVVNAGYQDVVKRVLLRPDPIPGVKNALTRLQDAGYEVIIATNRPQSLHAYTQMWLKDNSIPHDALKCVGENCRKGTLDGVDVVVDDSPHNAFAAAEHGEFGVLFRREWTDAASVENCPDVFVADEWEEVITTVERQADINHRPGSAIIAQ